MHHPKRAVRKMMFVSVGRHLEGQVQWKDQSCVPLGGGGAGEVERLAWRCVNPGGANAGERGGLRVKVRVELV